MTKVLIMKNTVSQNTNTTINTINTNTTNVGFSSEFNVCVVIYVALPKKNSLLRQ